MRRPDFFLVGALKSGTSAMSDYLAQHPAVFMGPKDTCFFGSDQVYRRTFQRSADWFRPDEATYLAMFDAARPDQRAGDACAYYLSSERAADEIKAFSPDAQILILLRDPVQLVHSLHNHWVYGQNEDIRDFDDALAAESDRRAGRRIPANAFWPDGLQYRSIPRYSQQVRRFFDAFGRDRVLVVLHDDMRADTPGAYRRVLEFMGVDASFRADFALVNPSKQVRSPRMQAFFVNPPAFVRALARPILAHPRVRAVVSGAVRRLNSRPEQRDELTVSTRAELARAFAPDVARLAELLDRDLSHWARP